MLKQEEPKSTRNYRERRWTSMGGITKKRGGAIGERNEGFQRFPHRQSRAIENLQLDTHTQCKNAQRLLVEFSVIERLFFKM